MTNSDVLIDKNYIINAGIGIEIVPAAAGGNGVGTTPRIESNGIIGNITGIDLNGDTTSVLKGNLPIHVTNNTIAFNTYGVTIHAGAGFSSSSTVPFADIDNNIFALNFALVGTTARSGAAVNDTTNTLVKMRANLFSNNGVSATSTTDDVIGVPGFSFNAGNPSTDNIAGNFVGTPGFVNPVDARPRSQGQGPAIFLLSANFDLNATSTAIDNALVNLGPSGYQSPALDFRSRARVNNGKGRPGYGPTDIGAFEYKGTGGIAGIGNNGKPLPSVATAVTVPVVTVTPKVTTPSVTVVTPKITTPKVTVVTPKITTPKVTVVTPKITTLTATRSPLLSRLLGRA